MKEKFPQLRVAGTHHGYFKPEDESEIVAEINRSGADFPLCGSSVHRSRKSL